MASVTILSDNGATSGSAGLKTSGGNDGVLLLQTTTSGGTPTTAISISNTQVVTYTNQPTYTGGTANGVLYLNGSKAVTSGTALVFDGNNLGVGTATPATRVHAVGNATYDPLRLGSTVSGYERSWTLGPNVGTNGLFAIRDSTAGDNRLNIDTSGNIGIGVTPSAWKSNYKATQVANATAIVGRTDNNNNYFSSNWYVNSSNQDIYINNGYATIYSQGTGTHAWYTAASGSAGGTISFTQAMTLDASGNLGIGTTSPDAKLNTEGGSLRISGTRTAGSFLDVVPSNTGTNGVTLSVSYYGSGNYGPLKFSAGGAERGRFSAAGDLELYITPAKDGKVQWTSGAGGSAQGFIVCNGNPELIAQCGGSGGVKLTSGATSWVSASDIRNKDIIEPIANAIQKVGSLSSVIYSFKDDVEQTRRVGLIAQEVLAVLPEAVYVPSDEEEMLGVRYTEVVPLIVAAIKELKAEVDALKGQA